MRELLALALVLLSSTAAAQTGGTEPGSASPAEPGQEPGSPSGETVIRGSEAPLSGGASLVPRRCIETAHPASSSEVLALVPGLRIAQHGAEGKAHQIFLRGFDAVHGSDVEVLVDGIPLNERGNVHGHGYVDLYGIVPESIRAVRVRKGAFLPGQGDFATAGTVNFELGLPEDLRPGLVRVDASHRGRTRAAFVVAPPGGPPEAFVAGESVFDPGAGPEREAVRGTAHGAWAWQIAPGLRLGIFGGGQGGRWESPGAVRLEDVEAGRMEFRDTYGTGAHGLSWRGQGGVTLSFRRGDTDLKAVAWGGARGLELIDNYTGFLGDRERGDTRLQGLQSAFAGFSANLDQGLPLRFPASFLAGMGWRFDQADQKEEALDLEGEPWRRDRDLLARIHGIHVWAGLRLQPWPWLEVQPSIRGDVLVYDVDDRLATRQASKVMGVASPRLAMAFPVHRAVTLFADYGRGFRTPEARSVTALPEGSVEDRTLDRYRGGKPAIAVADEVEAGLEVQPGGGVRLRLDGFGIFLQREIVFDHVSNTNLEQDGTRRLGVEASAEAAPLPWLRIQADVTWCHARFNRSGHPVPGSSPWMGGAALDLGLDRGVHGGARLSWSGRRDLAHGATAAGYALLDLHLGWRGDRWDLVLEVENATGADAMDGVYHFASWFDRTKPRSSIPVIHYTAACPATAKLVLTAYL